MVKGMRFRRFGGLGRRPGKRLERDRGEDFLNFEALLKPGVTGEMAEEGASRWRAPSVACRGGLLWWGGDGAGRRGAGGCRGLRSSAEGSAVPSAPGGRRAVNGFRDGYATGLRPVWLYPRRRSGVAGWGGRDTAVGGQGRVEGHLQSPLTWPLRLVPPIIPTPTPRVVLGLESALLLHAQGGLGGVVAGRGGLERRARGLQTRGRLTSSLPPRATRPVHSARGRKGKSERGREGEGEGEGAGEDCCG